VTVPPLPESPCIRVRLEYTQADGYDAGSRFFLSYTGGAPTAGQCTTLAGDIAAAWGSHIAPFVDEIFTLTTVDVQDIATDSGAFGTWTGTTGGAASGTSLPAQCAMNVEFDISRRYRGGKPRMFFPPSVTSDTLDAGHWTSTHLTNVNAAVLAFFEEIEALDIGSLGTLAHVNLSYYQGFTNVTNSSGRTRAAPKYRTTALVDPITGYAAKGLIGSQRRRRAATSS